MRNALMVSGAIIEATGQQKTLATDVLSYWMNIASNYATAYQPALPGERPNPHQDDEKFWKAMEACVAVARTLAPYQSPTYKALSIKHSSDGVKPVDQEAVYAAIEKRGGYQARKLLKQFFRKVRSLEEAQQMQTMIERGREMEAAGELDE